MAPGTRICGVPLSRFTHSSVSCSHNMGLHLVHSVLPFLLRKHTPCIYSVLLLLIFTDIYSVLQFVIWKCTLCTYSVLQFWSENAYLVHAQFFCLWSENVHPVHIQFFRLWSENVNLYILSSPVLIWKCILCTYSVLLSVLSQRALCNWRHPQKTSTASQNINSFPITKPVVLSRTQRLITNRPPLVRSPAAVCTPLPRDLVQGKHFGSRHKEMNHNPCFGSNTRRMNSVLASRNRGTAGVATHMAAAAAERRSHYVTAHNACNEQFNCS